MNKRLILKNKFVCLSYSIFSFIKKLRLPMEFICHAFN